MIKRALELLGDLPTTQTRVVVTCGAIIATTVKYVSSTTWIPSYEWLGFLLLASGVDAAQFLVKRTTDANYVAAKAGVVPDPEAEADRSKAP